METAVLQSKEITIASCDCGRGDAPDSLENSFSVEEKLNSSKDTLSSETELNRTYLVNNVNVNETSLLEDDQILPFAQSKELFIESVKPSIIDENLESKAQDHPFVVNTSCQFKQEGKTESYENEIEYDACDCPTCSECDSNSEDENELGKKQRLSALKIVTESDAFMDHLRKAKYEINELSIIENKDNPKIIDRTIEETTDLSKKADDILEDLELFLLHKNSTFKVSASNDVKDDHTEGCCLLSPLSPKQNTGHQSPSKVAELNDWVEMGIWMRSSSDEVYKKSKLLDLNLEDPQISPVSTMSSGAYLLEPYDELVDLIPAQTMNETTEMTTLQMIPKELRRSFDTELYLTGAPQEFTVDSEEEAEKIKDGNGSSSASFVSFSQEILAFASPIGPGVEEPNLTTHTSIDTSYSELISPNTQRSDGSNGNADLNLNYPSKTWKGKHENIYFGEGYDGSDEEFVRNPEGCIRARLLWANSKYWKDNQLIVPSEENDTICSQDDPSSNALQFVQLRQAERAKICVNAKLGNVDGDDLTNCGADKVPCGVLENFTYNDSTVSNDTSLHEADYEFGNNDGLNSKTEIIYDNSYIGRTDIFHPMLTANERKMLGITSEIPLGEGEPKFCEAEATKISEQANDQLFQSESVPQTIEDYGSCGSSIVQVEETESTVHSSFEVKAVEIRQTLELIDRNLNPKSHLLKSRCQVSEHDDDTSDFVVKTQPITTSLGLSKTRDDIIQYAPVLTPSPHKRREPTSKESRQKKIYEKLEPFYEYKKDLKKEKNLKIKLLKKDAKLSASAVKRMSELEMQELTEFHKNELIKIKSDTKFKALKAEREYNINKHTMKQDKWKGILRKLIEKRNDEKEMRKLKLESKLANLENKMKKQQDKIMSKADKKEKESENSFKKKWKKLNKKICNCVLNGNNNEEYLPADELLFESLLEDRTWESSNSTSPSVESD